MKYFQWFKGLIFIALACSVTAQGSMVMPFGAKIDPQKDETSSGYNLAVSVSRVEDQQESANLTISGENSKVSVEKKGTVTLVAGKSIIFHPGTKISSGSFLYASIESGTKVGKHSKSEVTLVTLEEMKEIEEQDVLSTAYLLFSPFPTHNKGRIRAGDTENGCFTSSSNELSGVYPEQQRKTAVCSRDVLNFFNKNLLFRHTLPLVANVLRPEFKMVLRL